MVSNAEQVRLQGVVCYDDVEAALIDAVLIQWRTEAGNWPFASDGPWHLIRKEWSDWDARDAKPVPRTPPSRGELERMRAVLFGWLPLVPSDLDRRIIVVSVTWRARGEKRVPWRKVAEKLGQAVSADAAKMRYRRAVHALTVAVNERGLG
ncbi:hypothetical protein [Sphingosinithalassobacter portus]|uniref:hypothetical protein n=1 Tax=Stakelama portus TaxID=2676234 RepID=UPI0011AB4EF9|nr:hypothetical protein [Sphingosinithalassobacter portus]